jgi:hypothetical protein
LRLELDDRFHHLERRRVGRRFRAPDLAEHGFHFGNRGDQLIGLLQDLGRLSRREAWQRRGHVKQIALVERREELGAEALNGNEHR